MKRDHLDTRAEARYIYSMRARAPRSSGGGWLLAAFVLAISVGIFLARQLASPPPQGGDEEISRRPAVQPPPDSSPGAYTSRFEEELSARLPQSQGPRGSGLIGLMTERVRAPEAAAPPGESAPAQGAEPSSPPAAGAPGGEAREREFLLKHDGALKAYQAKLGGIAVKWWKKSAVVRQVDAEFGRMERYMALKRQYEQDRDAYKWARSVVALPEVRSTILKHAKKPEVWSAGFGMMLEALKTPPPKPIFDEMKRFISADTAVSSYVTQFSSDVMPYLGKMTSQAVAKGMDIAPLTQLAMQVLPRGSKEDAKDKEGRKKRPVSGKR